MFELYLIRHGQTVANEKKLYCGATDLSLSRKGISGINKYKAEGLYPAAEKYYTSGMARCNETLQIIAGETVEFEPIHLLSEINVGLFEMKSYDELKTNKAYIAWISDKTGTYQCPRGESREYFYQRVGMGLLGLTQRILKAEIETALCVTHGGVIVAIMEQLFGNIHNFYGWQPEPGLGYRLTHHPENGYMDYEALKK